MSRVFAYCRVAPASKLTSTSELQATATAKGFAVDPDHMVIEVASVSVPVSRRPGWRKLLERPCEGDVLVVPQLDSLGGDVAEVHATIKSLASEGVRVHCLALGRMNLAGAEGKAAMDMLAAVVALEQNLRIERLRSGGQVSQTESAAPRGRPRSLRPAQVTEAHKLLVAGVSVVQIAQRLKTSRQTIMRVRARGKTGTVT
jgi:putative DNA-invertase from lambdoid prophage Rac